MRDDGAVDVDRAVGSEVAGYAIESVLGRGAMGVVYVARQRSPDRRVALKLIAPAFADDEPFRERFLREARAAAAIDHPHILPVYAAGESDGVLFIAMRLVEGEDLRALLQGPDRLAPERVLSIVGQVGSALDAAHARGLVHRDVKPGNILVAEQAQADEPDFCYLTDFGVSTWTTSSAATLTSSGRLVGTLNYAAPEQIEGSRAGPQADLYSLGCVLFECLTGRPPFADRNPPGILYAHLHDEPPSISSLRAGLPPAVDGVVRRALRKRPDDRHASCRDLTLDLRGALAGGDATAPATGVRRGARPRAGRRRTGVVVTVVGLGLVIAVLAVVAGWAILGRGSPSPSPPGPGPLLIRSGIQVVASHTSQSRTDASGNLVTYQPSNVIDGNVQTAWRTDGDGHGERVTLLFDNPIEVVRIGMIPGYAKTDTLTGVNRFEQDRIIKEVRYLIPGLAPIQQAFRPLAEPQFVHVGATTTRITVEVMDTTEPGGGPRFDYTAISEIYVYGVEQ